MRELFAQFMKHSAVGFVAFLVDFGIMVLLHETFGMHPLLASAISFVISVAVSYFGSMRYVFEHREGVSRKREFTVYMILSTIGLILNSAVMWLGDVILSSQGIDYADGPLYMVVKVIATFIVTFYNFFSRRKYFSNEG